MRTAQVDTLVRLTHDVPTLWLSRGDVGVVRSVWMSPASCYEVEFCKPGQSSVRALLNMECRRWPSSTATRFPAS